MKLAAIYNTFDGEELLEGSINCIYSEVDVIIIVYQTTSNFGEEYPQIEKTIKQLFGKYPKVILHHYKPIKWGGLDNERNKRRLGYDIAQQKGCTHYLFIDNDEYYIKDQFKAAKTKIIENNYDATACRLYTYFKSPKYRLKPLENYWVPFICQIKKEAEIGRGFNVYADPTRGIKPVRNYYSFKKTQLMMHHYSYIRKDIGRKLRNSSGKAYLGDINEKIKNFNNWQPGMPMMQYPNFEIEEVKQIQFPSFS